MAPVDQGPQPIQFGHGGIVAVGNLQPQPSQGGRDFFRGHRLPLRGGRGSGHGGHGGRGRHGHYGRLPGPPGDFRQQALQSIGQRLDQGLQIAAGPGVAAIAVA